MSSTSKHPGIYPDKKRPGAWIVQASVRGMKTRTRRVQGTISDARDAQRQLLAELMREREASPAERGTTSKSGSPAPSGTGPSLADWLSGPYARWQQRAQNEATRRKLVSPIRYLLASDLGEKRIDEIGTADVRAYVDWRLEVGALTFATRKNGQMYRARQEKVGAQAINKSLKVLSSALRLAHDEGVIPKLPKFEYLPEDDARPVLPPTEEQYRALVAGAELLRPVAPLLPEVVELLGEFGLRPAELFHLTWGSVDWRLGAGEHTGAIRVEEQKRTRTLGGKTWVPKNRKYRIVPFTPRGREVLEALRRRAPDAHPGDLVIPNDAGLPYIRLDVGPRKGGGAGVWEKLRDVSGVEGVAMRDLRHFFAVETLMRGTPLHIVSGWMGHSSIDLTSKRYGRFGAEAKEQWLWAARRALPGADVARPTRLRVVE